MHKFEMSAECQQFDRYGHTGSHHFRPF